MDVVGYARGEMFYSSSQRASSSLDSKRFATAATWCRQCSLRTTVCTLLRPQWQKCTTTCCIAADVDQVSALCLLDLTAAFNTVDHQLLLHRLEHRSMSARCLLGLVFVVFDRQILSGLVQWWYNVFRSLCFLAYSFSWSVVETCFNCQTVSARCFCQLLCVRRPLDQDSMATLVHPFVSSRVDYCCRLLTGSPKFMLDKSQWVLNAAARKVWRTQEDNELHWLDIFERIHAVSYCSHSPSLFKWFGTSIPHRTDMRTR